MLYNSYKDDSDKEDSDSGWLGNAPAKRLKRKTEREMRLLRLKLLFNHPLC